MNKLSSIFASAALAAFFGSPCSVFAQTVPAPAPAPVGAPRVGLSEQAAVERAVARNPTLHVALLQAAQADVDVRAEDGLYSTIGSANAGFTHARDPAIDGVRTADTFELGAGLTKPFAFGTVLESWFDRNTMASTGLRASMSESSR